MDQATAREAGEVLATLIGEIMEDEVDLALTAGGQGDGLDRVVRLRLAGEDIAALATAIEIVGRRGAHSPPNTETDAV